jgi:membrane protein YqaA with SNARE-associated domain
MAEILQQLFQWAQLPGVGLSTLFITSFVSATLIPLGAEPILFGYISLRPDMYWVAIGVATLGNSLGGLFDWWMGLLARNAYESLKGPTHYRIGKWLERSGPKLLLLAWVPIIGDPLCVVAGWMRLAWLPCFIYMTIGKSLRFIAMTWLLTEIPMQYWHQLAEWLHLPVLH